MTQNLPAKLRIVNVVGFFLACTSLAFSLALHAQELRIENLQGELLLDAPIPLGENSSISIDPESGSMTLKTDSEFSCSANSDDNGCQVSFAKDDGGFFTIGGQSSGTVNIKQGSTLLFEWSARGAWECVGTGDLLATAWNQAGKRPAGRQNVGLADLAVGTYQVGIACNNGPGTVQAAGPITVEIEPSNIVIPQECRGRQPNNTIAATVCNFDNSRIDCTSYASLFLTKFPGTVQGQKFFQPQGTYTALKFNTTDLQRIDGEWQFAEPQFGLRNPGTRFTSISRCPGDFDQAKIEAELGPGCYKRTDRFGNDLTWERGGDSNRSCNLPPGEELYFNVFYSNQDAGTPPAELQWNCGGDPDTAECMNNVTPLFK